MTNLPEHALRNREGVDEVGERLCGRRAKIPGSLRPSSGEYGEYRNLKWAPSTTSPELQEKRRSNSVAAPPTSPAWMAKLGARPVRNRRHPGAQLETARGFQKEFNIEIPAHRRKRRGPCRCRTSRLISPFSEYGASIWCDPEKWIAEAGRLLRPGGELVFMRK